MELFLDEIRKRCSEIKSRPFDEVSATEVIDTFDQIMYFQKLARTEGLLAMEETAETLDGTDTIEAFWGFLVVLIVDGTEPELLFEMGMNRYFALDLPDYNGLRCLMCIKGALLIQAGEYLIIERYLKTLLPGKILEILEEKERKAQEEREKKAQEERERKAQEERNSEVHLGNAGNAGDAKRKKENGVLNQDEIMELLRLGMTIKNDGE